jgi:hypothetical protein
MDRLRRELSAPTVPALTTALQQIAGMTPDERVEYEAHADYFRHVYRLASEVIGLRLKHGLNQAELAKRCGDDQAEIQRIETARP